MYNNLLLFKIFLKEQSLKLYLAAKIASPLWLYLINVRLLLRLTIIHFNEKITSTLQIINENQTRRNCT